MAGDFSNQNDGWDTENQSSYSPFKFYFRGGGSESSAVGVRVPIFLYRRMQELIQSGKLPYKTFGDFSRDADYHRIRWLEDNLASLVIDETNPMVALGLASQWADHQELMKETDEVITKLIEAARTLRSIGHHAAAKEKILNLYRDSSNYKDPLWRDHFTRRLEDAFNISEEDLMDV